MNRSISALGMILVSIIIVLSRSLVCYCKSCAYDSSPSREGHRSFLRMTAETIAYRTTNHIMTSIIVKTLATHIIPSLCNSFPMFAVARVKPMLGKTKAHQDILNCNFHRKAEDRTARSPKPKNQNPTHQIHTPIQSASTCRTSCAIGYVAK